MEQLIDPIYIAIISPIPLQAIGIAYLIDTHFPAAQVTIIDHLGADPIAQIPDTTHLLIIDTAHAFFLPDLLPDLRKTKPKILIAGIHAQGESHDALLLYDSIITPSMAPEELVDNLRPLIENRHSNAEREQLSRRELEVLRLLVQGNTAKEIAETLCISPHTVTSHRKNLSAKLGIKSLSGLAIYAVSINLIDLNDIRDSEENEF